MPFEVIQGSGANTLALQLQQRDTRDVAAVYINEPPGAGSTDDARTITVRLQVTPPAGVPVAPGAPAAVSRPTAQWTFAPRSGNLPHNRLAQNLQARLRPAGGSAVEVQPGSSHQLSGVPSLNFITSACGLDMYDLTARYAYAGSEVTEQLVIVVMKRIRYHYKEMLRSASPDQGTYCLTSLAGMDILEEAAAHLRRNYGVFLEQDGVTAQGAHQNFLTGGDQLADYAAPAAQLNAQAAARVLWIIAADRVRDGATVLAGMATNNVASVSCRSFEEDLTAYQAIRRSWDAYLEWARRIPQVTSEPGWLRWLSTPAGGNNPAQNIQRDRDLYLAVKAHGAEALVGQRTLSTLLHEIGHTLGLVPANSQAAGNAQTGWRDTGHAGHCANQHCIMWWEVELTGGLTWLRSYSPDIDFCRPSDDGLWSGNCSLYTKACDLSDIRNIFP